MLPQPVASLAGAHAHLLEVLKAESMRYLLQSLRESVIPKNALCMLASPHYCLTAIATMPASAPTERVV